MNLHSLVSGVVAAVNPQIPVLLRVSAGSTIGRAGMRTPLFQTPGAITASIAGSVLTVSAVAAGVLAAGQAVAGAGVAAGTLIIGQLSGTPGGPGTYSVTGSQVVGSEAMTTSLTVQAQVQALSWQDMQKMDAMVLQGERRAIYLFGAVDSISRPDNQGGDLITFPDGTVWLVAYVLETFLNDTGPKIGWCKVAATRQNA